MRGASESHVPLYCGVSRRLLPLVALLAACARPPIGPAPRAEFLVANADSTFWVTSDAKGVRMRGAPMVLARDGSHFLELYVADDDRSYYDAVFVGQRLYRRDILSGDSAQLLSDGEVAAMAERFAREHPEERRLGPDDEGAAHPRTSAMAELRVLDVHGRFASYEHLTDIDIRGGSSRHAAHGGVIDLRSGDELTVGDLFGRAEEARVVRGAQASWESARDSVLQSQSRGDALRAAIAHFDFNAASFTLTSQNRVPQVRFMVPGSGGSAGGITIPLVAQAVSEPEWWKEVRDQLPLGASTLRRWPHDRFELVARTDTTSGDRATLALKIGEKEWPVGVVQGPVKRIYWLDAPALSRETRTALMRAFDEASLYSEQTRVVQGPRPRQRSVLVPVAARRVEERRAAPETLNEWRRNAGAPARHPRRLENRWEGSR